VRLRPGNAGANNVIDLVGVLDAGIDGLPQDIAAGHRLGDDRGLVRRDVQVRADSAAGRTFALACRARNVGFAVVARSNEQIHAAISRGEPLHPGAQQSLFPSECYRYWGHYTDSDGDSVELDRHMRAHAHVEDNIRRLKDSAASRFPFCDFDANAVWLAPSAWLTAWSAGSTALPVRTARQRRTQDAALVTVAHPGPDRLSGPHPYSPRPRRLAHRCHPARRLPTPRLHHLSSSTPPRSRPGGAPTRLSPTDELSAKPKSRPDPMAHSEMTSQRESRLRTSRKE